MTFAASNTLSSFLSLTKVLSSNGFVKRYVSFGFVITQEVMANINVLCARVLNRIFGNFYGTFIVTKEVGSYLVSHQSPKGFASYIGFGHNMHRQLYIPLLRWTQPRNFASYSAKKLENAQANGNPRRYSCDPHGFQQNPNPSIPRDLS